MSRVYIFLADGFEDIEGLTVVDLMRRAGIEAVTVSIKETREITTSHGIEMKTDRVFSETDFSDADMLVLPGEQNIWVSISPLQAFSQSIMQKAERLQPSAQPQVFLQSWDF